MGKLHELLAIEGDLKGKRDKIRDETIVTFSKKGAHFEGWTKTLKMFDENRSEENSVEQQALTTTVIDKLNYMKDAFIQLWDARLQKDTANQKAIATIGLIPGGLENLPATFLLNMETELKKLRDDIFNIIPTLAPGIEWGIDNTKGKNVYKNLTPIVTKKTQKKIVVVPLSPATKEHKAQVTTVNEERPVGDYFFERVSGMISPAQKSIYLERLDALIIEFKKARKRANNIEIDNKNIGEKIFDFILA